MIVLNNNENDHKGATVICVVDGGVLTAVYSTSSDISVELPDYDNMAAADPDSEEYRMYQELEKKIHTEKLEQVF